MKTTICYMVAGMSSRFNGKIKQFAQVGPNRETLIEYSMNQAIKAGFDEIVFIVGSKTEIPFKEKFNNSYNGIPIKYAKQSFDESIRDKPWGTVDALLSAKDVLDSPFVVCNGDDIYGEQTFKKLNDYLINNNNNATIGYILKNSIPEEGTVNRGIFQIENNRVKSIEETFKISKDNLVYRNINPNSYCSMNIFAMQLNTLDLLSNSLKEFKKKNAKSRIAECLLPVEISDLISNGKISLEIFETKDKCIGVTNPDDEFKVRELLKELV